jgi:hypothetical protein
MRVLVDQRLGAGRDESLGESRGPTVGSECGKIECLKAGRRRFGWQCLTLIWLCSDLWGLAMLID